MGAACPGYRGGMGRRRVVVPVRCVRQAQGRRCADRPGCQSQSRPRIIKIVIISRRSAWALAVFAGAQLVRVDKSQVQDAAAVPPAV
jgi:hypothetical protein